MRKSRHWLPILLLTCPTSLLADAPGPKHAPGCHAEPPPSDTPVASALLEGYGTGGFPIKTTNPEAQKYFDPPAWWYPLRRNVAAALLAQGNARAAKIEAYQALNSWPNDPLSLRVLADCDRALGETAEEQAVLTSAGRNWTGSLASVPLSQI